MWYEVHADGDPCIINLDAVTYVWYDKKNGKLNVFGATPNGIGIHVPFEEYEKLKEALKNNDVPLRQQIEKLRKEADNLRKRLDNLGSSGQEQI